MAEPCLPDPVLLVVAAFSRYRQVLDGVREQLVEHFGPVALTSPDYSFDQTRYYEKSMGPGLIKRFFVFQELVAADRLAEVKLLTNNLERKQHGTYPEPRPLNLDPAFLSLGKFMLATTKDQAHRIYLRDGIYAEVTLHFQDKAYEPWPWTYADYLQPEVRAFLKQARDYYRRQKRVSQV